MGAVWFGWGDCSGCSDCVDIPVPGLVAISVWSLSPGRQSGSAGVIVRAVATVSDIPVARLETSSVWPLASAGADSVQLLPSTAKRVCPRAAVWFGWSDCSDCSDCIRHSGSRVGSDLRLVTGLVGERPSAVAAVDREEGLSPGRQSGSAGVIVRAVAIAWTFRFQGW